MFKALGYDSMNEFFHSIIKYKSLVLSLTAGGTLGTFTFYFEEYLGLHPYAYTLLLLLFLIEFITGVKASIKAGNKIESHKFGRIAVKIAFYTVVLGIIRGFEKFIGGVEILGFDINWYTWTYYVILHTVIFQLLISIFENGDKLGWDTSPVYSLLKKNFGKWLDIKKETK